MDSFFYKSKKDLERELLNGIIRNNTQEVKNILEYSTENKIILELNKKGRDGWYPLSRAIFEDNIEIVQLLIDYSIKNKISLELNEKNSIDGYPLLEAISNNNIEIVKLLIDYANKHKTSLELKDKNKCGWYPILEATSHNNIELVKLLINYAKVNNIILELNWSDQNGYFPIFFSFNYNNIEMFKILLKYSMEKKLKLVINENNIEDLISKKYNFVNLKSISDIKDEFINLICLFKNKNIIEVICSGNSYLLKKFNEFNENEKKKKQNNDGKEKIENGNKNKKKGNNIFKHTNRSLSDSSDEKVYSKKSLMPFDTISNYIKRSICKIEVNEDNCISFGTGFFVEIPIQSRKHSLYGLMTNNHVLGEEYLKPGKKIDIYFPDDYNKKYSLLINNKDFVFTSELMDISFVEINEKMKKNINPYFLQPSNKDAKIRDSIIIFQFPETIFSMAHGTIISSHGFNFHHNASTNHGSSGAPLMNRDYKVVGVHKSWLIKYESKTFVNVALKFSEIIFAIQILHKFRNEEARKSVRQLNDKEKEKLERYGLKSELSDEMEIIKKSLFRCDKYGNSLLFYRTNYTWYITVLSKYNNNSKYRLKELKKLDWYPIIPDSNKLYDNIFSKINKKEYKLIEWLKSTKLIYL
jgi:ankyrin repeat protein